MKLSKITVLLLSAFVLASCASEGVQEVQDTREKRAAKSGSIFGESLSSTNLLGGSDEDGGGNSSISVNSFLWRAALDTISFVPLSQVDPFGGVIISDWYSAPEAPNERLKLNVYILSRQLRSDGIRVAVFKQQKRGNDWANVQINDKTATQLENTILKRARQLRISLDQSPE